MLRIDHKSQDVHRFCFCNRQPLVRDKDKDDPTTKLLVSKECIIGAYYNQYINSNKTPPPSSHHHHPHYFFR